MAAASHERRLARVWQAVCRVTLLVLLANFLAPALPAGHAVAAPYAQGPVQTDPDLPPGGTVPPPRPTPTPSPTPTPMEPPPVVIVDPGAPVVPVVPPEGNTPVALPSLPISVTVSSGQAQAAAGQPVTLTVTLRNTGSAALRDLALEVPLHQALHWPGAQAGYVYHAATRTVSRTLPVLAAGAALTRQFRLQVVGVPADTALQQAVRVTAPGAAPATASAAVSIPRPVATAAAGPAGGVLLSADQRLRLDVPAGVFTTTVRLEHQWRSLGEMTPGQRSRLASFTLNAVDTTTGQALHQFGVLTMTIRVGDLAPAGEPLHLRYFDETELQWEYMAGPLVPDAQTGLIRVPLTHFSDFALEGEEMLTGDDKAGWRLLLNEPQVGLFDGSLSYSAPVAVPPGPRGLQPALTLSYNSGRVNGLKEWVQSDWVGAGVSLDGGVEIIRGVGWGAQGGSSYDNKCGHEDVLCLNDTFALVFQGTRYALVQEGGSDTYHTADESFLKIERKCSTKYGNPNEGEPCQGMTNDGGWTRRGGLGYSFEYWEVTTPQGTVYRLGARGDGGSQSARDSSEQRISDVCVKFENQTYNCERHGTVVYRWRVDLATDVYGHQTEYAYHEVPAAIQGYGLDDYDWDRESYLKEIRYALRADSLWGYKVKFDRICRFDSPASCTPKETAEIRDATAEDFGANERVLWFQREALRGIRVVQTVSSSSETVIREYRFTYTRSGDRSGDNEAIDSRVLATITQYGAGGVAGDADALPVTSLVYGAYDSRPVCPGPQYTDPSYPYGRLQSIDNGYGGVVTVTYGRIDGSYFCEGAGNATLWPHNYYVADKTVHDGVTPDLVTSYDYEQPCYTDGKHSCRGVQDPWHKLIAGFGLAVEQAYSGSAAPEHLLAVTEHEFFPASEDWPDFPDYLDLGWTGQARLGREVRTRQLDGIGGTVQQEVQQVYGSTVTVEKGDEEQHAIFVHLDESMTRIYTPSLALTTRTAQVYDYATALSQPIRQYDLGATQVLVNGSFEGRVTPSGAHQVPAGWTAFTCSGSGYKLDVEPEAAWLGGQGLVIEHTGDNACDCGAYQDIPVEPNTSYRLYVRARLAASPGPNFRLLIYDPQNPAWSYHTDPVLGTTWQLVTLDVTTPNVTTLRLRVQLRPDNPGSGPVGEIHVDDVYYEALADTGDEKMQATHYISSATYPVRGVPLIQRVYAGLEVTADGTELAMTRYTYDGQPVGTTGYNVVTRGDVTAQSVYHTITADWLNSQYYYTSYTDYDPVHGNPVDTWDAVERHTSHTTYDGTYSIYPIAVTNALSQTSYMSYDYRWGKPTHAYDPNGVLTRLLYDPFFGRLTRVVEDMGGATGDTELQPTVWYTYTDAYSGGGLTGLRIETVRREVRESATQIQRSFEFYTGRGILVQARSELTDGPSGQQAVTMAEYDGAGRAAKGYTPEQYAYSADFAAGQHGTAYSETTYDRLGRVTDARATDGTLTRMFYDGLATAVVDAEGRQKISIVDAAGQLVTVKEFDGEDYAEGAQFQDGPYATTHYAYDLLGRLLTTVDALGQQTSMTYDTLGRKVAMHDPNMGDWTYGYNAVGNLAWQHVATEPDPQFTCFYYDDLNRLTGKTYGTGAANCPPDPEYGGYAESYWYDEPGHGASVGQRTRMQNTEGAVSWEYDRRGRVTAETRAVPDMGTYTLRFSYDSANRVVSTLYPTGEIVTSTYTPAWQPYALLSNWQPGSPGAYVTSAVYNVRGQPTSVAFANGVNTLYDYDEDASPSFRLEGLQVQLAPGHSGGLDLSYVYDNVGNVLSILEATNSNQQQCFTYDALNRLTGAWTQGSGACSGYAAVGDGYYNHSGDNGYAYDELGSPERMAGRTYVYDLEHPQAVRYAYNYGANGRFDDFSSDTGWVLCGTSCAREQDGEEWVLRNGTSGYMTATQVRRNADSLNASDTAQVEFKLTRTGAAPDAALQIQVGENPASVLGVIAQADGHLRVRRKINNIFQTPLDFSTPFLLQPGTWYVLRLYVGDDSMNNKFRVYVWERDDPAVRAYYETSESSWVGQQWRFANWVNVLGQAPGTVAVLDSYFELDGASAGVFSYRYDDVGNMIARTEMGVGYTQAWDTENRLSRVDYGSTSGTPDVYTFAYDADGARVLQTAPGNYRTAYIGAGMYEETLTPTLVFNDTFDEGAWQWEEQSGDWDRSSWVDGAYQQYEAKIPEATSLIAGAAYADVRVNATVYMGSETDALAGILLRDEAEGQVTAYFVGLRNDASEFLCGIYEKVDGIWSNRTPGATACMVRGESAYALEVRAVGGRIEMLVDGALAATWVDTSPLPTGAAGLATWNSGTSVFDDVSVRGVASRSYYVQGGGRVAMRQTSIEATAETAVVAWLSGDYLGSTTLATTVTGEAGRARYLPFGNERGAASTLPTDFTFAGQRATRGLGLIQMGARWYDPCLNRWTQPDTVVPNANRPQSLNRYGYVYNNPVRLTDPGGNLTDEEIKVLLGKDYDTLWSLWMEYDRYWIDVLKTLESGDRLFASRIQGRYLEVQGKGQDVRLMVFNEDGTVTDKVRLEDWQGQGAYRFDKATLTDEQDAYLSDEVFNHYKCNPSIVPGGGAVFEPVFQYRDDQERLLKHPIYLGSLQVVQKVGWAKWSSWAAEVGKAVGIWPGWDGAWGCVISAALLKVSPGWGIASFTGDFAASIYATYTGPKHYYSGWLGMAEEINPEFPLMQYGMEP